MIRGRLLLAFRRRLDIRPGEERSVIGLFAYFFIVMVAGYIILPLKINNFLRHLDLGILPIVLFGTAVGMSFVAAANSRFIQKLRPRPYIQASLVFFIGGLALFWLLAGLAPKSKVVPIVFWFWAEMFLAVSVIQFWILVNDVFSPRRVKRFIGLFVVAGLLGGIAGSIFVIGLSGEKASRALYLLCIGVLSGALLLIRALPSAKIEESESAPAARTKVGYAESFRTIIRSRYLLFLSGMMLAGYGASQVISFQFQTILKIGVPEVQRQQFLGVFGIVLLLASMSFHILVTGRLLKRFGLRTALFVSPALLALGAAAGWLVPAGGILVWTTIMRGADKSLTHSLSQSTREILYIPVPFETRAKAKVVIDLFINKFADAFAALLNFVAIAVFGLSVSSPADMRALSGITLAFILAWAILNRNLIREYVATIRRNLTVSRPDADQLVLGRIDVAATKLVFDTLESRNRSSVLYAMNLLDLVGKDKLSPELKAIISAKSSEVQAGAFDALLDIPGETLVPDWEDVLDDADLGAEIREVLSLDVYQTVMREHVRTVASAETRSETDAVAQMEVAKALGMMSGDAPLVGALRDLLKKGSPEVVRYALDSAGRQAKRGFIPLILPHLGRPATAEAAASALVAAGDRFAGMLDDALRDGGEDLQVRKAIPAVLGRMATPRAASVLAAGLGRGDAAVLDETIEALFRIRTARPEMPFDETVIRPVIVDLVHKACTLIIAVEGADRAAERAPLAEDLGALLSRTVKQIFELLSLVFPYEDIVRAYQNYHEGRKKSVDFALELLETILPKDMKDLLLPWLEEHPPEEQARIARRILKALER
jgi:AAA family ATP:ADP antiporter